jgi:uncharacterized membrane protein (DUF106 family)
MMDFLFGWILDLHPALGMLMISLIISLIISLAIKYLTDQNLMKQLRSEMKELQQEIKDLKNNPKKMAKINDRFMETNMKYMSHSIPIILVFGWMSSHMGYEPLIPGEPFKVTAVFNDLARGEVWLKAEQMEVLEPNNKEILHNEVDWLVQAGEGEYEIEILYENKSYKKDVILTREQVYAPVEQVYKKGMFAKDEPRIEMIKLSNEKILPFKDVPILGSIPWVKTWGWFGTYFLFSIVFSLVFRKMLDLH